ncbi:hypothetical protein KEM60_03170 [Austwickia sp. TVS 96-490-7B]|uniref:acyl-CoA thioesterase n=1 Tax=Austwickia sp. TVS 96-490-7B TaxID=2830843 RepID=UPI001C562A9B|nr:hotdog domain-containing protein [Austwickia sp. TVS 96-490-7B]MBW3086941.1 hypothetical protein [Austwickia sp. TVS 96-490-7B]
MPDASGMRFHSRKWVKPEDLNANGTIFGGALLSWIDEECAIYAILQLGNERCVTKYMSEINFVSSAWQGDLIELGVQAVAFGRTSLTLRCEVRNMVTRQTIIKIDKIVFVGLDEDSHPIEHGYDTVTFDRDRIPRRHAPIPRAPIPQDSRVGSAVTDVDGGAL